MELLFKGWFEELYLDWRRKKGASPTDEGLDQMFTFDIFASELCLDSDKAEAWRAGTSTPDLVDLFLLAYQTSDERLFSFAGDEEEKLWRMKADILDCSKQTRRAILNGFIASSDPTIPLEIICERHRHWNMHRLAAKKPALLMSVSDEIEPFILIMGILLVVHLAFRFFVTGGFGHPALEFLVLNAFLFLLGIVWVAFLFSVGDLLSYQFSD